MPVHLTREFLKDLRESRDARLVRQVLSRALLEDGSFAADKDDHRYDGIKDAWIRYITRGTSAYRVIFIRKGADVFLYRAGVHSIEDNLSPPTSLDDALEIRALPAMRQEGVTNALSPDSLRISSTGSLLKTSEATFIRRHIESMYHVKHKEICIVSPFIDVELLESNHSFGRFLDRAVEEDTMVVIVTSGEQSVERLSIFKKIEERGMNSYFLTGLHSKLFLFDVDVEARSSWQQGVHRHAIIGSSNLTRVGLGFGEGRCNEELNCRVSSDLFDEARLYVTRLTRMADDYKKYAFKSARRQRLQ